MTAIYNELDAYPAQWLARLADAGHIASGTVDPRSIREVKANDVRRATQFHAFAGIGVWSYALRLAGWPDDRPVWTGSCPCQPFSVAGRRKGTDDERHLWPEWLRLIRECRPPVIFGEQVASADGRAWLDAVRADLEALGYAVGAADLCAAGVGAPHIRQRLYFGAVRLADAADLRLDGRRAGQARDGRDASRGKSERLRDARGLGDARCARAGRDTGAGARAQEGAAVRAVGDTPVAPGAAPQWLGDTERAGLEGHAGHGDDGDEPGRLGAQPYGPTPTSGFWGDVEWLACRDGKHRPAQPGIFPLARGATGRVGRLRAYGNAIVSEAAATFVTAFIGATEAA